MIYNELEGLSDGGVIVDPLDPTKRRRLDGGETSEDLLVPVVYGREVVYEPPRLDAIRDRTRQQLTSFHAGILRQDNPHRYPVGLEKGLHELKTELVLAARGAADL